MVDTSTKLGLGALLIVVSSAVLFYVTTTGSSLPTSLAGLAALAMAAGALLLGTSKPGAGV